MARLVTAHQPGIYQAELGLEKLIELALHVLFNAHPLKQLLRWRGTPIGVARETPDCLPPCLLVLVLFAKI